MSEGWDPPTVAPPPRKGRSELKWVALAVASVLGIGVAAVLNWPQSDHDAKADTESVLNGACDGSYREVTYKAGGTARNGSFTAETPTGTKQQTAAIPLTNKAGERGIRFCFAPGEFVYFAIQNEADHGTITCEIEVNGRTISSNESSGAYAIAQCDGQS